MRNEHYSSLGYGEGLPAAPWIQLVTMSAVNKTKHKPFSSWWKTIATKVSASEMVRSGSVSERWRSPCKCTHRMPSYSHTSLHNILLHLLEAAHQRARVFHHEALHSVLNWWAWQNQLGKKTWQLSPCPFRLPVGEWGVAKAQGANRGPQPCNREGAKGAWQTNRLI